MKIPKEISEICHQIMSCKDAEAYERDFFKDKPDDQYCAILRAGSFCAREFLGEFSDRIKNAKSILLVCGSGHNGADAMVFTRVILQFIMQKRDFNAEFLLEKSLCNITLCIPPTDKLKAFSEKIFYELEKFLKENKSLFKFSKISPNELEKFECENFDLLIEGLCGMNFKPPAKPEFERLINILNKINAGIKASIDLPAGAFDDTSTFSISPQNTLAFNADVSYPTGIAKLPLFSKKFSIFAGRVRHSDIGFFEKQKNFPKNKDDKSENNSGKHIIKPDALKFLNAPRRAKSSKKDYGHLFIVAGSESYKGAALLNARAALRSGVGLVTAFVPESCAAQMAAAEPSAIWIPCPVDALGCLALETFSLVKERCKHATAILAGSGLGNSKESSVLIGEILKYLPSIPAVLDADAIFTDVILSAKGRGAKKLLITPHEGEFARTFSKTLEIEKNSDGKIFISDEILEKAAREISASILLKSNVSRLNFGSDQTYYSVRGSPTLSRGGSGDILAGLAGGLLARTDLSLSAQIVGILASHWLGITAEIAENELGQNALSTGELLKYLPNALNAY